MMRDFRALAGMAFALLLVANAPALPVDLSAPGSIRMEVDGLRSAKGVLQICLTRRPDHFPDCTDDPDARRLTVSAAEPNTRDVMIAGLAEGDYALAVIHDENANRRLDTFAGIPREGVGFSRNPRLVFGPPRFGAARFMVGGGETSQNVRMRYFL